ncbi:MAG: GGDEF domain-containing protein [Lachnospiraceae bacterium]
MNHHSYEKLIEEQIQTLISRSYGSIDEGESLAQKIFLLGRSNGDERLQGIALNALCEIRFLRSGASNELFSMVYDTIRHEEAAGDFHGLAVSYNLLGILNRMMLFYVRAMDNFLTSRKYVLKLPEQHTYLGALYGNIASVYRSLGNYEEALSYLQKTIPYLEQATSHRVRNLMNTWAELGLLYLDARGDAAKAGECLNTLTDLIDHNTERIDVPYYLYWLLSARVARVQGNRSREEMAVRRELDLLSRLGIYSDSLDGILEFMEYLIQNREYEWFALFQQCFAPYADSLSAANALRWLDACIAYDRSRKDQVQCGRDMAQYYDTSLRLQVERQAMELQAITNLNRIEKMQEENSRLTREAETDHLTGLPNRYSLNRTSDTWYEQAYRRQTSLAVEILDVDFFKQYNDTYGHQAGDECLRKVAGVLAAFRDAHPGVYAARYGGDEFVLLYDGFPDAEVLRLAGMLRENIRALQIPAPGAPGNILTISQGIRNSVPTEKNKLWDFLYAADNALYQVKQTQKGDICLLKEAKISDLSLRKGHIL